MRNIYLLIGLSVLLVCCSKNDDPNNPNASGSVKIGKPTLSSIEHNGVIVNCKITVTGEGETVNDYSVHVFDKSGKKVEYINGQYIIPHSYSDFSIKISYLEPNTTYIIKGVAKILKTDSQTETERYGEGIEFSTPKAPVVVKPKKLDNFSITTTSFTVVESAIYSAPMKKYSVSLAEHQRVDYSWSCSDSKVVGILISDRASNAPKDGISYSKEASYSSYYGGNGSYTFQKWNQSAASYATCYIWTYDDNLNYSNEYYYVQKLIPGIRRWSEWRDSPY